MPDPREKVLGLLEATAFIGSDARIQYRDRNGEIRDEAVYLMDAKIVHRYGPCFVTDRGEIMLERIVGFELIRQKAA